MPAHKGCQKRIHGLDSVVTRPNGRKLCLPCHRIATKKYQIAHPKTEYQHRRYLLLKGTEKDYYATHRQQVLAKRKHPNVRLRIVAYQRRYNLKRLFGLTVEEYDLLFALQGGMCAICSEKSVKKRLAVDHDHMTGRVRGLLCEACNQTLGKMRENPYFLRQAALYLENYAVSKNKAVTFGSVSPIDDDDQ